MNEVQELIAVLKLKDQFSGPAGKVTRSLDKLDKQVDQTSGRAYKAGTQIGTGIKNAAKIAAVGIGLLASQVALGLKSLADLEQQVAQTEAVIKSTGGAAGITAKQVGVLAEKFEDMNAVIGDEVIRSAENMLLTFTNVKDKAFEPALQAILDMNTAMGKGPEGLTTTAIQVGKALNDPIKGITALRKVGVTFTDQQLKQIKALVKSGKTLEAQKIIIAELNKEFGGSFLAQGNTTAGKIAKFQDAIEDLQRSLAERLLPVVGKVAEGLAKFLKDPAVVQAAEDLGTAIAGLFTDENISAGADVLKGVIQAARDGAPLIADAAKTVFGIVSSAVGLFRSLPPEIQKLAIGAFAINKLTGGLVTNIGGAVAGGIAKAILGQFAGNINVNGAVVNVNGAVSGAPGAAGAAAKGGLGAVSKMLLVAEAVGLVLAVNEVRDGISKNATEYAKGLAAQNTTFLAAVPDQAALLSSLAAIDQAINELQADPLAVALVTGPALEELKAMRAKTAAQLAALTTVTEQAKTGIHTAATDMITAQSQFAAQQRANAIANAEGIKQNERATAASQVTAAGAIKAATDKAAQASREAGSSVSSAVERKDLSVAVSIPVSVSVRGISQGQVTFKKYGGTVAS